METRLKAHTHLHRGKHRVPDRELQTTRLVGGGWRWECDCGHFGSWQNSRAFAVEAARLHRLEVHGIQ